MGSDLRIVPLDRNHDREGFDCGDAGLNLFLQRGALQNRNAGFSVTYVLTEGVSRRILAYYTIAAGEIACGLQSEKDTKSLPRYPVPVLRLCRLAVDRTFQKRGYGGSMLVDVLRRALHLSSSLGLHAVEVDALNDTARNFYRRYGFRSLPDDTLHLYLPLKAFRRLLEGRRDEGTKRRE